ncbi:MAG: hypothetical protein ACO1NW_08605 [Chitinophagaceae bacterium]
MKKLLSLPFFAAAAIGCVFACSKKSGPAEEPPVVTPEITAPSVNADSVSNITTASATFYGNVPSNGGAALSDRGIFIGSTATPTENKTTATSYQTNGRFTVELKQLTPNTTYFIRGYATNSKGTAYSKDLQFTTTGVPQAEVFTDTVFASGAHTLFAAGKIVDTKGIAMKEVGICLSKNATPTIADTKIAAASSSEQNLFFRFNNLEPATTYHIRAYGTNTYGTTVYGSDVTVTTIARGNVTYTLNQNAYPTDDEKAAYARIKSAFDEAVVYYNNYTSITKHLTVNYNPGVQTADATFAGNVRFGSNTGYQKTGTALHELAHTVGVGTHAVWNQLIQGGVYQGKNANAMLRFMTRTPTETIKGDGLHFWPYGINGANEDSGQEMLYITNVLIVQGMKKDGLPSSY